MWLLFLTSITVFIWFLDKGRKSLRNYGLGEGVETLYGKNVARAVFGKDWKKPE